MKLLLDTHEFLWWCAEDPRLGEVERQAVADGRNRVFLSSASVWEMAIKQALGRLEVPEQPSMATARMGIARSQWRSPTPKPRSRSRRSTGIPSTGCWWLRRESRG